jgi:hypothetical protein
VHHIYITNDEKSMAFVTCDAFIVTPTMPSLVLNEPSEVRIPFPDNGIIQEEASHQTEESLKEAYEDRQDDESF